MLELKNPIDKNAQGTLISENSVEKRSKEELMEHVKDKEEVNFMYKVIANNAILKFPIYITEKFNIEGDDVKFGFNIVLSQKRSSGQSIEMKIPVVVNTGKLKLNQTGGNISSAQSSKSMASIKQGTQE